MPYCLSQAESAKPRNLCRLRFPVLHLMGRNVPSVQNSGEAFGEELGGGRN